MPASKDDDKIDPSANKETKLAKSNQAVASKQKSESETIKAIKDKL